MRRILLALFIVVPVAHAHQPIFIDQDAGTPDRAVYVDDIDLSQVTYNQIGTDRPRIWVTFDGRAGQTVFMQLGVPVIERLRDYRPAMALVGPGLPEAALPFATPPDSGAVIFSSAGVEQPRFFDEPFTGTQSWIVREERYVLPETGRYYIVAYHPADQAGKLWLAFGEREQFSLADLGSFPEVVQRVRTFHEAEQPNALPCFLFPAGALLLCVMPLLSRVARSRSRFTPK